jgi:sulfite reductase alpha subunit-like flavoprotein
MGGGGASEPVRVLAIFGSESGTAKAAIKGLATSLGKDGDVQIVDIKEGNSVGALETLKEKYDFLLIATSSFGEGDPPDNYAGFLAKLLKGAKGAEYPLTGMQHAVLGLGSSCYDTFQNVPRLSDKMLGECGSRRIAQRCELDDSGPGEDTSRQQVKTFEAAVLKELKARKPAEAQPVCAWSLPASQILEKSESDLSGFSLGDGGGGFGMVFCGVVALAAVGAGLYYNGMLPI